MTPDEFFDHVAAIAHLSAMPPDDSRQTFVDWWLRNRKQYPVEREAGGFIIQLKVDEIVQPVQRFFVHARILSPDLANGMTSQWGMFPPDSVIPLFRENNIRVEAVAEFGLEADPVALTTRSWRQCRFVALNGGATRLNSALTMVKMAA